MEELVVGRGERISDALQRVRGDRTFKVFLDEAHTQEIDADRTADVLNLAPKAHIYTEEKKTISLFINPLQKKVFPDATLEVGLTDSIESVKEQIAKRSGVPVEGMRLVFGKTELKSGTVAEQNLQEHSEVFLFVP